MNLCTILDHKWIKAGKTEDVKPPYLYPVKCKRCGEEDLEYYDFPRTISGVYRNTP